MEIKPITILKCIVYPTAAFAAGAAAGLYLTLIRQPEQRLTGDPCIEQPGQKLGGDPCIEQPEQRLGGILAPTANKKMRQAKEARLKALELIETANGWLSRDFQIRSGQIMSGYVYIDPRERITEAMRQAEELLKQAEKWEREALKESGAVTPPAASETESQAAVSKPHS